jgi:hypothetical protein
MEPIGETTTLNELELVPLPRDPVTVMGPEVTPVGTVAVICVLEFTVNVALVPLKPTLVMLTKLVPVIVMLSPTEPAVGVNEVMAGAPFPVSTTKLWLLVPVPLAVVTLTGPVEAETGTVAVICESEFTVKAAPTPLKATEVALVK